MILSFAADVVIQREPAGHRRPVGRAQGDVGLCLAFCSSALGNDGAGPPGLAAADCWRPVRGRSDRDQLGERLSLIARATIAASSPTPMSSDDLRFRRKWTPTK